MKMQILKYTPVQNPKSSLKGFITLKIPKWGDFIMENITYFEKDDGKKWINLPTQIYENNGEKKYNHINRFEDSKTQNSFVELVLKALDEYLAMQPKEIDPEIPF